MIRRSVWWLTILYPIRLGVIARPRHSLMRNVCILILRFLATRVSIHDRLAEIVPIDRPQLTFEPADSMVMDAVYWFGVGGYEGVLANVWEQLCGESHNVLEVGGNVGIYSVLGGKFAERYTVLEPVPEVASILSANLRKNNLKHVELLIAAAIPELKSHDVEISVPNEGRRIPVGAYLSDASEISARSMKHSVTVKGLPFHEIANGRDLIKIDAEGIEASLLSSAWSTIMTTRPTLVIEVLPEAEILATVIRKLVSDVGYLIHIVPAYGSDQIVTVSGNDFLSTTPGMYKSKDVVLSVQPIFEPFNK